MALLSLIKLQKSGEQIVLHNFDVNATLPIRGLLAILIVCHHIGQRFSITPIGIFSSIGPTLVSVFFFISGYRLMISFQKKGKVYLSNFFRHRLSKLLPTFVILTLACIAYSCILKHHQLSEIMHNLFQGDTPLPHSWFMYAIIYQYIAFYISCKISRTKMQCVIVSAFLTLLSMIGLYKVGFGDYWWISQPSFILGMVVAAYENVFRKVLAKNPFLMVLSVLIVMFIGLTNGHFRLIHIHELIASFLYPNLMPLLVIFMVYAYGSTYNNIARYLGKISLEIYLIQGLAIMAVQYFTLPWYAFTLCVFIITIPAAAIAHKLGNAISSRF
jgi:peptidoglycan/LPS O-acetylase OafA/YrhL